MVILWAVVLAFLPMLAISSIHWLRSVGFMGRGGMMLFLMSCRAFMSGWLYSCVRGCWHAVRIIFRVLWCIVSCFFHAFCCALGRNSPWILALWGSGGVGFVIQVFTIHWLRESMISLNLFCVFSHCVCVSWSLCSILVRWVIARFCDSRKVVWSFWRLSGGME